MKKIVTIVLLLITCFININIINADALNDFADTIDGANNYINRYTNVDKYIITDNSIKFKYTNNSLSVDNRFTKGGLLNLDEYNVTKENGGSYLYTGIKYFTMTESGTNVYEVSSYTPEVISKDELSGLRVTEYIKEGTTVIGEGTYTDPWIFYKNSSDDYIVAFDAMGGIGGQKSSVVATRGFPMPQIISTKPVKENYIFNGWYDSNGVKYYDENGASARNYDKNTGTILYAKWTSKSIASITTSNDMGSATQIATLNCKHTDGVVAYYWGTEAPSASSTFTQVTSTKNMNVEKTVDATGTYYLVCKDHLGDTSLPASITYYNYTVKEMLNNVSGSSTTYNTTYYTLASTNTYIAAENSPITVRNAANVPNHSNINKYKGYSIGDPSSSTVTLSDEVQILTTNGITYTTWFTRNNIYVYYQVQSGESLVQGSSATGTYSQDNNGIITKNGTKYADIFRYGTTSISLTDNSASGQFAINKTGYRPATNAEWICKSGCTTPNTTYKQNNQTATNTDLELCDTSTTDCDIILKANFATTYNDNNYVVKRLAGNLMDGNTLIKTNSTLSGSGDLYTMTAAYLTSGAHIQSDIFTPGKTYVLTYNIQKTAGTLKNIGGHAASANQIKFTIDGINSSISYSINMNSSSINNISDDNNVHSIYFEFVYNGNSSDNNNIYIQPNRGYNDSVTVKITNLRLYEVIDNYSKDYNTTYTSSNLASPGKDGYTFDKWYNNPAYSTGLTTSTTFSRTTATFEDITTNHTNVNIYGKLTPKTITISYNANGGSGAPSSHTYIYSPAGTTNLSTTKPTRDGYKFMGWSTSSSAVAPSYGSNQAWRRSNLPSSGTTFTLYAVWAKYKCPYYSATLSGSTCTFNATVSYDCQKDATGTTLSDPVTCSSSNYSSPSTHCASGYNYVSNTCSRTPTCPDGGTSSGDICQSSKSSRYKCYKNAGNTVTGYSGTCVCQTGGSTESVTVTNYSESSCSNYCTENGYDGSTSESLSPVYSKTCSGIGGTLSGSQCRDNTWRTSCSGWAGTWDTDNNYCSIGSYNSSSGKCEYNATINYSGTISCSKTNYSCPEGYLDATTCHLDDQTSCNSNNGWTTEETHYSCPYGTRNNDKCSYPASV